MGRMLGFRVVGRKIENVAFAFAFRVRNHASYENGNPKIAGVNFIPGFCLKNENRKPA
jgi:hypothetical protein